MSDLIQLIVTPFFCCKHVKQFSFGRGGNCRSCSTTGTHAITLGQPGSSLLWELEDWCRKDSTKRTHTWGVQKSKLESYIGANNQIRLKVKNILLSVLIPGVHRCMSSFRETSDSISETALLQFSHTFYMLEAISAIQSFRSSFCNYTYLYHLVSAICSRISDEFQISWAAREKGWRDSRTANTFERPRG